MKYIRKFIRLTFRVLTLYVHEIIVIHLLVFRRNRSTSNRMFCVHQIDHLTPRTRILLQKLIVNQSVNKFSPPVEPRPESPPLVLLLNQIYPVHTFTVRV